VVFSKGEKKRDLTKKGGVTYPGNKRVFIGLINLKGAERQEESL